MKKGLKKLMHSKTIIVILILLLIVIVSLTGTYAWFTWNSTDNTKLTMTIGKLADVVFIGGNDITANLTPVFNYFDGEKTTFNINNRDTTGATITYTVKLNITSIPTELRRSDVKYSLALNGERVTTGNFLNIIDGTTIDVFTGALSSGTSTIDLYIYIDGNEENDTSMIGKSIVGNITLEASEFTGTLTDLITNLYDSSTKSIISNNSVEYNYASTVNLMNDRLGGTTADYNSGNIRYYGPNPNNYIDVGDRDSSGNIIPWRIIGVFKNIELSDGTTNTLVKIVRDVINIRVSWDTSPSDINGGWGVNEWSQADLMKLLNPGYESETVGGSLYYNSQSGNCYAGLANATTACDFTSVGLSDEVKDKIETVVWYTGGNSKNTVYVDVIYKDERSDNLPQPGSLGGLCPSDVTCNDTVTRTAQWTGKIAPLYVSDYGYAADFNYCNGALKNYNTKECNQNDWMYTDASGGEQYLTNNSRYAIAAWGMYPAGNPHTALAIATCPPSIHPTLFLKSGLNIVAGDGSKTNPYVIG